MKSSKKSHVNQNISVPVILGVGVFAVIVFIGCLVGAICIEREYMDITGGKPVMLFTLLVAVLSGVLIGGKVSKNKNITISLLVTGIGYLLLMFVSIMFFDGVGENAITGTVACICGCILGIFLNSVKTNPQKRKIAKRMRR